MTMLPDPFVPAPETDLNDPDVDTDIPEDDDDDAADEVEDKKVKKVEKTEAPAPPAPKK